MAQEETDNTMSPAEATLAKLTDLKRKRRLTPSEQFDIGEATGDFLSENPTDEQRAKYGLGPSLRTSSNGVSR